MCPNQQTLLQGCQNTDTYITSSIFKVNQTYGFVLFVYFSQRNEAGSSTAIEFMAFKQCMNYLIGYGLLITTFISDRHVSIASHMKKVLHKIIHYFDIWHLKKVRLSLFQSPSKMLFSSMHYCIPSNACVKSHTKKANFIPQSS